MNATMLGMRHLLAALVLPLALTGCSGVAAERELDAEGKEAQAVCEEEFVADRLKAPASAKFSDQTRTHLGQGHWRVNGTVDSENSFGAMIRGEYSCEIELSDDGGRWLALDVTVR